MLRRIENQKQSLRNTAVYMRGRVLYIKRNLVEQLGSPDKVAIFYDEDTMNVVLRPDGDFSLAPRNDSARYIVQSSKVRDTLYALFGIPKDKNINFKVDHVDKESMVLRMMSE